MKYFKTISSLSELKKQFRELVLTNHPDKGGNTEVMQEINAEFEVLFIIWKDRSIECGEIINEKETAFSYRSEFYTEFGWKGSNYDNNLRTSDISARIRAYAKEKYPNCTFSVTTEYYSMGSSIHISLTSANFEVLKNAPGEDPINLNEFYVEKDSRLTERGLAIMIDINNFVKSYRYSDCDGMIDYFHVNFYYHLAIGKYGKPFILNNKKDRAIVNNKPAGPALEKQEKKAPVNNTAAPGNFDLVDYSEKAVALFGDTREIKDQLKEIGGRFNLYLTHNGAKAPGWIFSKSKADQVRELINNSAA